MFNFDIKRFGIMKSVSRMAVLAMVVIAVAVSGCKKKEIANLPNTFNSLSTEEKMEYLIKKLPPDSVALFICEASMGKKYDSRIELGEAVNYAYTHYNDSTMVIFDDALNQYGDRLPLNERAKFFKLINISDPDMLAYELGLKFVGTIRENDMDVKTVKEELDRFMKESEAEPDTYKRFIKGFKNALEYDRGHDLDEKIYKTFITYPDSIQ